MAHSHPYKGSTNGKRRDPRAVVKAQAKKARRRDDTPEWPELDNFVGYDENWPTLTKEQIKEATKNN